MRLLAIQLALSLLTAWSTFGQPFSLNDRIAYATQQVAPAGGVGSLWPTNAAIGANFWWEPSVGAYTTNSGTATLPELAQGGTFNLTNKGSSSTFFIAGPQLNGNATIYGLNANSTMLQNTAYTSSLPYEVWILLSATNDYTSDSIILDSINASSYGYFDYDQHAGAQAFVFNPGNSAPQIAQPITNKYFILTVEVASASVARAWTNGVATAGLGSFTANPVGGMLLGQFHGGGLNSTFNLVGLVIFTNQDLGASWGPTRSNLFYYFTNRYALSLPD